MAEEPALRLLGVFGVAERVGDDERRAATGPQEFVAALNKGDVEIPLLPQCLVLLAGKDFLALELSYCEIAPKV